MKKVKEKVGFKFSHKVIMGVLGLVFGLGGYGGYVVYQQQGQFGAGYEENLHTVERVIDGDTFVLTDKSVVRMLLMDAPEIDQCFGQEAKQELQKMLLGRKVRLQKDSTATDSQGRLLRYVFVYTDHPKEDNVFANDIMLQQGYARIFSAPKDKLFQAVMANSAGIAKANNKGLYKVCAESSNIVLQSSEKCNIKGNNSTDGNGKVYFYPGCQSYGNVKMELNRGDEWFCSEKEAVKAGYKKASGCPKFTD